jgi:hypothetical protein
MLRPLLAISLVAASGAAASAGTYLGLGLGTAASMSSTTTNAPEAQTVQGNGRSGKLMLGMRFGRLSIEGAAARYGMFMNGYGADNTQLSAALKYSFPLGDNFEAFLRGGLEHSSIGLQMQTATQPYDASGNGWLLGGGFEYRLNAVVAGGSVFVDYEHTDTSMSNNSAETFDQTTGIWMAGVTLSL